MMIEKIFNELVDGDRPSNPRYDKVNNEINDILGEFKSIMNERELKLLEKLLSLYGESNNIECEDLFKKGFAIGQTIKDESYSIIENIYDDLD